MNKLFQNQAPKSIYVLYCVEIQIVMRVLFLISEVDFATAKIGKNFGFCKKLTKKVFAYTIVMV